MEEALSIAHGKVSKTVFQDHHQRAWSKQVHLTGFLALQSEVKWLKAPMMGVEI